MNNLIKEVSLMLLLAPTAFTLQGCKNDDGEMNRNWAEKVFFKHSTPSDTISFVLCDSGYIGTAYSTNSGAYTKGFWACNTQTKVWSQVADFPGTGQSSPTVFVVKGKAYILDAKGKWNLWEYDPRQNNWTKYPH